MGSYAQANATAVGTAASGTAGPPDITQTHLVGRSKFGFGLNAEHELTRQLRGFLRVGWSDGKNESFSYTEIDDTFAIGADLRGAWWGRGADKLGLAAVTNGLSADHERHLELGGKGFLLGDGTLRYGRETIVEAYYTAPVYRGVSFTIDDQLIVNPGYNLDRGPVIVGPLRVHVEI